MADNEHKEIIMLGDLNTNFQDKHSYQQLHVLTSQYQLKQLIDAVTRPISGKTTDLIFTSKEDNIIKSGVLDIGMSDHLPIFISRKINSRISIKQGLHTTISYRRKKDFIASDFDNDLVEEIPLSLYEIFDDPNDLLDCWYSHFMKILDRHAPLIKCRVRNNKLPGWFNSESIEDYYKNLLTDNVHNPRQLWKILKDILPTNDTVSQITLNINGKEISDPIEVGDLFNEYFSSIANNFDISLLNNPINTHLPIATNHIKFTIPLITIDDILNLAAELDQNKSTGLDGIPAYFIKSSIHSIAPIILRICNMSIENGVFPNMWKKARLIPIYKAETRTERNNYRPISILPILSKLLERHVANSYVKFLTENDILSSCQHGFRAHHSCESTLILICEHLLDNIEQGLINGIALIDLSKAFDLVDHRLLLQKLEQYGITPIALKWFKSYLNDRYQVVQIASSLSNPALIKSGVPQGSILGPILFLIFINDLPSYVGSSKPFLFADDSTLISSGSDLHELSVSLKSDMTSVSRWTNHNKMSLNPGKTKIMKIYSQSKFPDLSPITIEVNNNNVKKITSAILLGVTLDQHLKWDRQINTIYNIINSRLYLLKRIRSYLTFQSHIQLYYALIYPHLLYCSTVWGNANNDLITCLLKLQKRAARLILEQSTEVPSIVLFRKLNWIPIFNLIKMRKILLVFNTLKTSWPPDLRKLFVFVRDSHPIPTRRLLQT
ncbi:Hypothetical predicted protein [Paramuricea clavata]|uniref:Uncharacterized protein n=1 Tax=Paramuricea clavata TaxID=317549 RepID=A0A6S7H3N9_PARCT|nr:Hypothetical predicted protein [Paramuricea clavata]